MTLTQIKKAGLDSIALDHVFTIGASGTDHYTFQGEGLNGTVNDPTLYLTRGKTYRFENGTGAHAIRIQSADDGTSGTLYNTGVTNNNTTGTVIVEVQHDAPDVLYYQCASHANMKGTIYVTGALADGGVTTVKIADDAVTPSKMSTMTSEGKLRLNPSDNSTTWQRENKHMHQIRDDVYVESTVNVGDKAGFDFTPLAISAFSYTGTTLTLTTASHTIAVGANVLIKDSASGFQEAFNTISGTTGTTVKVTRGSDPSSSLSTANTKVIVHTPADPRGCINVAKDHDKFDQNTFNPILRGYVGKDLDTATGTNTEAFKIELKKDSSATDHVATLLHSTRDFGSGQRLALTIDDGNSYPDGKNLVLTQNGVKITADDSAFTDSDELLEVEGNAKIDGNLEVTGTLSAGGDGTISGDELFLTDSIKHVGDTDTSISFPSNDLIRFRTNGSTRLDIDSSGNVGIGTTSPVGKLAVSDGTVVGEINPFSGSSACFIGTRSNHDVILKCNAQEKVRIRAGGGLTFNGDTAAANALDDYEEGSWTPTAFGWSATGTNTYGTQNGRYIKVGNLVTVFFHVEWSNLSNASGVLAIGGFPYSHRSSTYNGSTAVQCRYIDYSGDTVYGVYGNGYGTSILLYAQNDNSNHSYVAIDGAGRVEGTVSYLAA